MTNNYLNKEWETRTCGEGEKCWCRSIWVKGGHADEDCVLGTAQTNKETADHIVQAHNEYLKETVRNAESQIWYSNALEALQPLRSHMHDLIIEIEAIERFCDRMEYPIRVPRLSAAKAALDNVELFFTGVRPENGVSDGR
jgi:hypothetical protein